MKKFLYLVLTVSSLILSGCSSAPPSIVQHPTSARPQPISTAAQKDGAIFQATAYRPMFEDRRARMVGDIMTIAISEKTSAGKSTANSGSKSGSTANSVSSMFAVPATTLGKMGLSSKSNNAFDEKDAASRSNNFTGTIGVTVIEVLANGNLVVSGEKQIAFDKGAEFVRFSGVVNPDTIMNGNIVPSTQLADVRVEYRTNSRVDRSELMSQFARFFLSILPL